MASSGKKAFLLRLDPAVWEAIESLAAQELRSVNGQIEWLLRESLQQRGRPARGASPGATSGAPDNAGRRPPRR
jgi:hypothetical protein